MGDSPPALEGGGAIAAVARLQTSSARAKARVEEQQRIASENKARKARLASTGAATSNKLSKEEEEERARTKEQKEVESAEKVREMRRHASELKGMVASTSAATVHSLSAEQDTMRLLAAAKARAVKEEEQRQLKKHASDLKVMVASASPPLSPRPTQRGGAQGAVSCTSASGKPGPGARGTGSPDNLGDMQLSEFGDEEPDLESAATPTSKYCYRPDPDSVSKAKARANGSPCSTGTLSSSQCTSAPGSSRRRRGRERGSQRRVSRRRRYIEVLLVALCMSGIIGGMYYGVQYAMYWLEGYSQTLKSANDNSTRL